MRKSIANYFDDFLRVNSEAGVVSFKEHKELLNKFVELWVVIFYFYLYLVSD